MHGVGHTETVDSVTLPKVVIHVGGFDTVLSPAHVLMKSIGPDCRIANFGMDLFKQAGALRLDVSAMTLELIPSGKVR